VTPLDRGRASTLLGDWFEGADDATDIGRGHPCYRRWFAGGGAVDAEVRAAFADDMMTARAGGGAGWSSPTEALALVLLLDQVPRHVYRGDGRAFASDGAALGVALDRVRDGSHEHIDLLRRFGRYPGRNAALGRASRPAELDLLGDLSGGQVRPRP
jgi:uncharacterized protein (DUF924 family)